MFFLICSHCQSVIRLAVFLVEICFNNLRYKTRCGRNDKTLSLQIYSVSTHYTKWLIKDNKKTPHAHSLLSTHKCWLLKDYKKQTLLLKIHTLSITNMTSEPYTTTNGADSSPFPQHFHYYISSSSHFRPILAVT